MTDAEPDITEQVPSRWRTWFVRLAILYAVALGASHVVWSSKSTPVHTLAPRESRIEVREVLPSETGFVLGERPVELVYRDVGPLEPMDDAPVVVLLHGSPGSSRDFHKIEDRLAREVRVLAPDLPGFGLSTKNVADYSVEAHAHYVLQLLEELGVEKAHLLGFSMGGGVAIHMADREPELVESICMVAAIGVQEFELFGDYDLNHHVHRVQLAAIQTYRYAFPHFGAYDAFSFDHAFGHNFFDTDQRPLRGMLERYEGPMHILHGRDDFLVLVGAAEEHARIVPQSELEVLEASHFLPWNHPEDIARTQLELVQAARSGTAITRQTASADRRASAAVPLDPKSIPPFSGAALFIAMFLIAAATLLTEDLTCIAVGLVIAQGRIGFVPGSFACFCGIFFGDVLLYLMGRFIGRAAMGKRPLRWWLTPERIDRASVWFRTQGIRVIFVSRFLPGFRVPTYFAAGVLKTHFLRFASYFAIAVALWTPVLVGFSMWAGREAADSLESLGSYAIPGLVALALFIYFVQSLALPMFSHRGRRLLLGRFRRKFLWEFWPPVVFYLPLAFYIVWLMIRYRSLTVFTAANPGIPTGGFIGESKSAILEALGEEAPVPASTTIEPNAESEDALRVAREFQTTLEQPYPIVLKPDTGQRGSGVLILEDEDALTEALAPAPFERILQEYAPGQEYGVFWIRHPDEAEGRIFSITEKELPTLIGDGERTLEALILDDARAVCMATTYLNANAEHIMDVPKDGEPVQLVDLGTHCLGAIFKDANELATPELTAAIGAIANRFEGFYFGRFDLRVPSVEDFRAGRNLSILELNGVTSEATHIYDAQNSLFSAYGTLFEQWRLAFAIGAANAAKGTSIATIRELIAEYRDYRRLQKGHRPQRKAPSSSAPSSN